MKKIVLTSAIALALLGGAVASPSPAHADSETLGTLGGAAAGGLIGSQFGKGGGNVAATVGGVIAGGVIGNAIGRDADESRYDNDGPAYAPAPAPSYSYYQSPPPAVYTAPAPVYYAPPPAVVYEQPAPVVVYGHRWGPHYRYYRPYYGY